VQPFAAKVPARCNLVVHLAVGLAGSSCLDQRTGASRLGVVARKVEAVESVPTRLGILAVYWDVQDVATAQVVPV
jgi:hypothetical protein